MPMLLENLIPALPKDRLSTVIIVVAVLGSILLIYSQFVEAENRRDLVRMVGAMGILVYALSLLNTIFILTALGIFITSFIQFLEVYMGYHTHKRKGHELYAHIEQTITGKK